MTIVEFRQFWKGSLRHVVRGSRSYYAWVTFLLVLMVVGAFGYAHQVREGLVATAMRDQVMWGFYIGNFTFFVGVAAAAVVLVIPAYIYGWGPLKEVVIIGELLAISAIVISLGFVTVDIGRPDRVWHLFPLLGNLNFPKSLLAWDVIVLNLYLILNVVIVTHLLYRSFHGKEANKSFVVPLVLASIPAAISIHTVTAFLYSGLAARPFWNASILAPRFLASAFCSGPAIILVLLQVLRKWNGLKITDQALWKIAELMAYAVCIDLFLLLAEVFKDFYSDTQHLVHAKYLYFGLGANSAITLYAWASVLFIMIAAVIFLVPSTRKNWLTLNVGCVLLYAGVYIEKGIGLVIPGLTPDALGEIYAYFPSRTELQVAAGVFATGFLVFTVLLKIAMPVALGHHQYAHEGPAPQPASEPSPESSPEPAPAPIVA